MESDNGNVQYPWIDSFPIKQEPDEDDNDMNMKLEIDIKNEITEDGYDEDTVYETETDGHLANNGIMTPKGSGDHEPSYNMKSGKHFPVQHRQGSDNKAPTAVAVSKKRKRKRSPAKRKSVRKVKSLKVKVPKVPAVRVEDVELSGSERVKMPEDVASSDPDSAGDISNGPDTKSKHVRTRKTDKEKDPARFTITKIKFMEIRCFLCKDETEVYKDDSAYVEHLRANHIQRTDVGRWTLICRFCNKLYLIEERKPPTAEPCKLKIHLALQSLLHHMMRYHDYGMPEYIIPYRCKVEDCNYVTVKRSNMYSHVETHNVAKVACDKCGRTLMQRSMRYHKSICEQNTERLREEFHCEFCCKKYCTKQALQRHSKVEHTKERGFLCYVCPKTFSENQLLAGHMYAAHKVNITKKPVLHCNLCEYTAIYRHHMSKHKERTHGDLVYPCPVCSRMFKSKAQLMIHSQCHAEKNFKCNMCDFATKRKEFLRRHINAQHEKTKMYKCPNENCAYETGYFGNLCKHTKICNRRKRSRGSNIVKSQATDKQVTPTDGDISPEVDAIVSTALEADTLLQEVGLSPM